MRVGTGAWWRPPAALVLLAVGVALLVAVAILGALDLRAAAHAADRDEALSAARAHLVDLGAASGDPAARGRAVGGAIGGWRERLVAADATGASSTVVRTVGLEDLAGDTAHALAVGLVAGRDDGPRAFRASVALSRVDGRWLVADVTEVP